MHLLAAQSGQVQDGQEAVDLGQTPAPLIIISAADSDLALLAAGYAALADPKSELRLANALALRHPSSVDLHPSAGRRSAAGGAAPTRWAKLLALSD